MSFSGTGNTEDVVTVPESTETLIEKLSPEKFRIKYRRSYYYGEFQQWRSEVWTLRRPRRSRVSRSRHRALTPKQRQFSSRSEMVHSSRRVRDDSRSQARVDIGQNILTVDSVIDAYIFKTAGTKVDAVGHRQHPNFFLSSLHKCIPVEYGCATGGGVMPEDISRRCAERRDWCTRM
ncbi:hypothetical protein EVAR_30541_1 [Eumeta japonica]|uniref:Uncharacterized protein n=1 Tax=Eumeta variegata TaxID=151549 RepID=A0A4C1VP92_EUMVA|nr:hypothetical protein EVAR_30541_1 [Eumeta japonica]